MDQWITVFLLVMFTGVGDGRREVTTNLMFYDLNDCTYFAKRLSHRYTSHRYMDLDGRDRVVTYCIPKTVNSKTKVY
jgi:hypothetical protein